MMPGGLSAAPTTQTDRKTAPTTQTDRKTAPSTQTDCEMATQTKRRFSVRVIHRHAYDGGSRHAHGDAPFATQQAESDAASLIFTV